jgi:hypothetical protein
MLRLASIILVSALLAASPAAAQTAVPYHQVTVKFAEPPSDPSFAAFRGELAAAAKRRVYGELARLVVAHGFFWERDFGAVFDRAKSGVENLAVAIGLEQHDGQGWTMLATFAAEPTAAPIVSRPGIICAPARPKFDEAEFNALVSRNGSDPVDWAYPRKATVAMHAAANASGGVIETLGPHFVRVLERAAKAGEAARVRWTQVLAPSGRTGFVAPGTLMSLLAERLCYDKDVTGRWRIAGFVGGGD